MTPRSILARSAACLTAFGLVAGAAMVPTIASAQAYRAYPAYQTYQGQSYQGGSYYDPCRRDQVQRGTGGALVGGGIGALAGSGIAGSGNKTEGAVLGGIIGAVIGSQVGKAGAACSTPYDPNYRGQYSAEYGQDGYYAEQPDGYYGYDQNQPAYGYEGGYEQGSYYGQDGYQGYDSDYRVAPVAGGSPTADNCTLAESPIYLPDGRVQKRFVRVCRDASGNYQVVD